MTMTGLKKVLYFLGTLDDQDIDWMVRNGMRRTVPAQTRIISEGQPTDWLYFILSGEFSVKSSRAKGEVARVGPGEILGEISFVDSRPPSADVTSIGEATVGAVAVDTLERKMERDTAFAARFYKAIGVALADRLRLGLASSGTTAVPADLDDLDVAPHLLDTISLAGTRFADIQRRPWGSGSAN
jgi:CRP/FNR family transcriptional regulator, cyclic AMP receptor protein